MRAVSEGMEAQQEARELLDGLRDLLSRKQIRSSTILIDPMPVRLRVASK